MSFFLFPTRARASAFVRMAAIRACLLPVCVFASPVFAQSTSGDAPLSLHEALTLAQQQAPALAAQNAAVSAAQSEAVRAAELPDPQLIAGIENLPIDTRDRFSLTRDFMTMRKIGVMQVFPRKEKRRLRGERAADEIDKESALLTANQLDVRRQTALAWIELSIAERARDLLVELHDEMTLQVTAANARLRGGSSSASDVLAAQGARAQLDDRLDDADRQIAQARAALARWIGVEAAGRPLGDPSDFTILPQSPAALLDHVGHHAGLLPYDAMESIAQTEVALARAEKKPDWSLEVAYAQRGPEFSNMVSIEARIDLPLFTAHRQDPEIAAKTAMLEKVRAEREDAVRMHREETARNLAGWQSADKRAERFENEILPLAHDRATVALAAYRGGRGDLQPVLTARSGEIESRLAYIEQLRARDRAWAELAYLLPTENQP